MKKLLMLFLLCSSICIGQQGINYKAVITDDGEIVANTYISLYFSIIENATTDVYRETHVKLTDENGIIVANIGEGTPTFGNFQTIDWTEEHYLNVSVNIGNGIEDLGTTAFKNVPYALYAKNSGDKVFSTVDNVTSNSGSDINNDNFVFGATQLDGSNVSRMFFNKPKGAFRAGHISSSTFYDDAWDDANVGTYSFATGINTRASGYASVALGSHSTATGFEATAIGTARAYGNNAVSIGRGASASGDSAIALGDNADAKGNRSVAIGFSTAQSFLETALGVRNTEVSGSSDSFVATDRLLVIGNGTSNSNASDALVMLKNGNTELNGTLTIDSSNDDTGYTLPTTKGTSGQVLTVNTDNAQTYWTFVSGTGHLEKITEDGNTGYRLLGREPVNYGNIGLEALDFSYQTESGDTFGATGENATTFGVNTWASGENATALGFGTWATGDYSMSLGYESEATGNDAFALGYNTLASGNDSFAAGYQTEASADFSTSFGYFSKAQGEIAIAFGNYTEANGFKSTAFGDTTIASGTVSSTFGLGTTSESFAQTTLGLYNTEMPVTNGSGSYVADQRLFVIGNGTGNNNRSNAMVVLKNGNTTINGKLQVEELQAADSGDADMKAYIYGLIVGSNGNKANASSGGFTVIRLGTGQYRISFNNAPSSHADYLVLSTLHQDIGFVRTSKFQQYFEVRTYNTSETLTDINFNFVVYKK